MRLPDEFCERMQRCLGDDYAAFSATYDRPAEKGLRVNRRYIEDERLLSLLDIAAEPIPYQQGGYYHDAALGQHPLHHAGAYYLQDPSAMITANAVDIPADATVLDMCASPGGKTTQLAAMLGDTGLLVANEIDLGRAKTLLGNVERMGYGRAAVTNLPPHEAAAQWGAAFDVVVVDAPCSGEGMFRKTPAAIDEWSPENVRLCAARQREILDSAMRCVRYGGVLIYSTCTFAPEEDEESVRYILASGDFEPTAITPRIMASTVAGDAPGSRRFYPHIGRGEGHFVAAMRRTSPTPVPPKSALYARVSAAEERYIRAFLRDVARTVPEGEIVRVGGQICLVPAGLPASRYGMLSAGVKLGELQSGRGGLRLVPHHMLFKCLPLYRETDLSLDDPAAVAYLHGESISADMPDGWGMVCIEGCPVGGCKAVGGELKNHYPKGLRI